MASETKPVEYVALVWGAWKHSESLMPDTQELPWASNKGELMGLHRGNHVPSVLEDTEMYQ